MLNLKNINLQKFYGYLLLILSIPLLYVTIGYFSDYVKYETIAIPYFKESTPLWTKCKDKVNKEQEKKCFEMLSHLGQSDNKSSKLSNRNRMLLNTCLNADRGEDKCSQEIYEKIGDRPHNSGNAKGEKFTLLYMSIMALFIFIGVYLIKKSKEEKKELTDTNIPLNGSERLSIMLYFIILLCIPILGWITIIATMISFYIKKIDKEYEPITKLKTFYIYIYTVFNLLIYFMVIIVQNILDHGYHFDSNLLTLILMIAIALFSVLAYRLFFTVLDKHREWVVTHKIFS